MMIKGTKLDIWCHITEAQVAAAKQGIDWLALELLKVKKKWERWEKRNEEEAAQGAQ